MNYRNTKTGLSFKYKLHICRHYDIRSTVKTAYGNMTSFLITDITELMYPFFLVLPILSETYISIRYTLQLIQFM